MNSSGVNANRRTGLGPTGSVSPSHSAKITANAAANNAANTAKPDLSSRRRFSAERASDSGTTLIVTERLSWVSSAR